MKIRDYALLMRSKNAGVDHITVDLIFREQDDFERILRAVPLNPETIAQIYGIERERLSHFLVLEKMKTVKFTLRRSRPGGSPGEHDLYGSQHYIPLAELEVDG